PLPGAAVGGHHPYVDEHVEGDDAHVHGGGGDVLADHRQDHAHREPEPSTAVQARGLDDLRGDGLDRGHEQHHVEADQGPHHGGPDRPQGQVAAPQPADAAVQAHQAQHPVEQPAIGRVDEGEEDADHDGRDHVGEEADHPVQVGAADPADLSATVAADGDQYCQDEGEGDHDRGQHDQQDEVVDQGLSEDAVVEQSDVVVQTDELRGGGQTAPVGQG